MTVSFIVLGVCLVFSGMFSAVETAFTSLSPGQIEKLASRHKKSGGLVKRLSSSQDILLTTILIGNNLVNIGASALATTLTIRLFGNNAAGITTGLLTLFILIFGEVTPKQIAFMNNEAIALAAAPFVWFLSWVFRPIIRIISFISGLLLRLLRVKKENRMSIENILHTVDIAEDRGLVDNYENQVVRNILRLDNIKTKGVMTHRTDVFSLSEKTLTKDCYREVVSRGFSRIPIYSGDPENIVGIVMLTDLLLHSDESLALKNIMSNPLFVSTSRKVYTLFHLMRREKIHMAIVLDEYGGLAGIVTREDAIEEILGDLYDENEDVESEKIIPQEDGSYLVKGDTPFHVFTDRLRIELNNGGDFDTLGGYLIDKIGRIPSPQEVFVLKEGEYLILQVHRNRIEEARFLPRNEGAQ